MGKANRSDPVATVDAMPEVEEAFEEIVDAPLVGIIMGSKNDKSKMHPGEALHEAGIRYEVRVMSAHRTPTRCATTARTRACGVSR